MNEHLSSHTLDALALGALDGRETARAEQHLAACARCRADRDLLRAGDAEFARSVLPRTLPVIRERLEARPGRWRLVWLAVPALALATAVLVVVLPRGIGTSPTVGDDLQIKGGATLEVIAKRGDRVWRVDDASALATGDAIRFVVAPGAATHVMVASVDGAGAVTIYYPYGGAESGRLAPGARVALPGSIVLDAAPGPERVFALFTRAPLAASKVHAALAALGARGPDAIRAARALDVPCDAQATIALEKAPP